MKLKLKTCQSAAGQAMKDTLGRASREGATESLANRFETLTELVK